MLIPSIDLMGGKIVQLIGGERLALAFDDFEYWIDRFSKYSMVQLIDLDAAMRQGENRKLIEMICKRLPCQVGGGLRVVDWAREAEQRGAGEILLTSMDTDGMRNGFDCELTRRVSEAVQIPVIASGGAGSAAHFAEVFKAGKADAALAASIFHFGITDSRALKAEVAAAGVPMRLPC